LSGVILRWPEDPGEPGLILLSLFEIQTEGKHGWAEKLPTWKFRSDFLESFPGFRGPITGYHVYLFTMILFLVHLPFLFMRWDLRTEVIILSAYTLIVAFEDFFGLFLILTMG